MQVVALGMTTNERLNASRYKHFHREPKQSTWSFHQPKYSSPFDRGLCNNMADFFHVQLCGVKASDVDWKKEYDINAWLDSNDRSQLIQRGVDDIV